MCTGMCACVQVRGGWEQIDGELLRKWPRLADQVARLHCGITPGATRGGRGDTCSVSEQDLQLEVS